MNINKIIKTVLGLSLIIMSLFSSTMFVNAQEDNNISSGTVIKDEEIYFDGEYAGRLVVTDITNSNVNEDKVSPYGTWHWGVLWSVEPGAPVFSDYSSHVSGVASVGLKETLDSIHLLL